MQFFSCQVLIQPDQKWLGVLWWHHVWTEGTCASILSLSVSLHLAWVSPSRATDHMARTGYTICGPSTKWECGALCSKLLSIQDNNSRALNQALAPVHGPCVTVHWIQPWMWHQPDWTSWVMSQFLGHVPISVQISQVTSFCLLSLCELCKEPLRKVPLAGGLSDILCFWGPMSIWLSRECFKSALTF